MCPTLRGYSPAPRGPELRWGGHAMFTAEPQGGSPVPDVSVIMPVHAMPLNHVRRAVRSVRKQDHPGSIELVLWDDGSQDSYRVGAYAGMSTAFDDDALALQVPNDGSVHGLKRLIDRLDSGAIEVEGLSVRSADLDDVFLSLTGSADPNRADVEVPAP